jgi:hypothetical protein
LWVQNEVIFLSYPPLLLILTHHPSPFVCLLSADENNIVLYVQAALCAQVTGEWALVKEYAAMAFQTHDLLFGGGVDFFRQRYSKEVGLKLRPGSKALTGSVALNLLWPQ